MLVLLFLARCALAENKLQSAQDLIAQLKEDYQDEISQFSDIQQSISAVELHSNLQDSEGKAKLSVVELEKLVKKDPDNIQARYDLALAYSLSDASKAVDEALKCLQQDRYWNQEAPLKLVLKILDTCDPTAPLALSTRKRLSNILF